MKKLLFALIFASTATFAGTVYRDRPFPVPVANAAPCMVPVADAHVNANMIISARIGARWKCPGDESVCSRSAMTSEPAVVVYVPSDTLFIVGGDVRTHLDNLLKRIEACKKN